MDATPAFVAAGLHKTSLIDYPGKVACVVFLTGCNFTCPFCHNPDLARGRFPRRIGLDELSDFLEERRTFLDGVVITGGEPTLQPGLDRLCHSIHAMGLSVKLDTNGSRPDVVDALIRQGLIDYIAMDVKTAPQRYAPPLCSPKHATAVMRSIRLIMQAGCDYEFRTTCLHPFVDDAAIADIARTIKGAKRYVLQPFRPQTVLSPEFFSKTPPAELSQERMIHLQRTAAAWVECCVIR